MMGEVGQGHHQRRPQAESLKRLVHRDQYLSLQALHGPVVEKIPFPLFARQYVGVARQALMQSGMIGELEEMM